MKRSLGDEQVFIMGFYGSQEVENRGNSWHLLNWLSQGRGYHGYVEVILMKYCMPTRKNRYGSECYPDVEISGKR